MTTRATPPPQEPTHLPTDERQVLIEFLDYYRAEFDRKIAGLSADQLRTTTAASSLTLGGLTKHMALVEDTWFTYRFAALDVPEPWLSAPWDDDDDWDFHSAPGDSPQELIGLFHAACDRSRACLDESASLDALSKPREPEDSTVNLRWILVHMIEEYARHCGHADFLREAIDGQTDR